MLTQANPPTGFPHIPFLAPNFLQFGNMMNPFMPAHFVQMFQQHQQAQKAKQEENGQSKENVESKNGLDLLEAFEPPFKMPRLDSDAKLDEEKQSDKRRSEK